MIKPPNFFIVGAARSGTTSLWCYLKQNPQVFMPSDELNKEPAYFSDKNQRISTNAFLNLFKDADPKHKLVGEASTAYLTDHKAAIRIKDFNPNAKIIIILRNPAERAYSLYNWMVQEGYEYVISFEKALEVEKRRVNKIIPNFWEPQYYWNYMYYHSGLYYGQVKKYLDSFGENTLILKFEDFQNQPNDNFKKVCNFLGICPIEPKLNAQNLSRSVYSPQIQFVIRKLNNNYIRIRKIFGMQPKSKHSRDFFIYLGQKPQKPPPLSKEMRTKLLSRYENHIYELAKITNDRFLSWLE